MYVLITLYRNQTHLPFESTAYYQRPFAAPHHTEENNDMV